MTSNVSRRSVAKGAAWSIPAVAVAASAPALAASPSTPTGIIYSVPWSNTYPNFRATNGNDGQYLPYVMYAVSAAGQVGSFNKSTPNAALGNPLGTASYPSATVNSSGKYIDSAGNATSYGLGSVITVTMTQTSGVLLPQTQPQPSNRNWWPFLVPRENHLGGCGHYFEATGYSAQTTTGDPNQYFGNASFDAAGNATFTWTLTWNNNTSNVHDGCDAITYDIHTPVNTQGKAGAIGWTITTNSPAGTNTVTV